MRGMSVSRRIAGAAAVSSDICLTVLTSRLSMRERVRDLGMGSCIPGASNSKIVPIDTLKGSEWIAWWYVAKKRRYIESTNIEKVVISDYSPDTFISSFNKSFLHFFISHYLNLLFGRLRFIGYLTSYIRNIVIIHFSRPSVI
jgi:hypothetical protein